MQTTTLKIAGMMCQGCVAGAKMALEDVAGVEQVEVSLEDKQAVVTYDEGRCQLAALKEAIVEAGFSVE